MVRVYQAVLRFYPVAYQRDFAAEMVLVFRDAYADVRDRHFTTRLAFYGCELAGLLCGAASEHVRQLLGPNHWYLFRRFDMRPQYRFPRSTIGLMALILLGLFLAIEKAKAVAGGGVLPWSTFWSLVVMAFLLVCLAAVAGWAILFALKRSGMHRLSDVQTWPDQKR